MKKDMKWEQESWLDMTWFTLYFHVAVRLLFVSSCPHWQVSVKQDVVILCNIYYSHTSRACWNKMSWQQRAEQNKNKKLISWSISLLFPLDGGVIMSHSWREISQLHKWKLDSRWERSGPRQLDHKPFLCRPSLPLVTNDGDWGFLNCTAT